MKLQLAHFNSLISLVTYFNNDKRYRDFITEQRWGGNVVCPFCGCTHTPALEGEIELDEMHLGGRETNKHQSKKTKGTQGRSTKTKTPIFGMVQRDGLVHALKVTGN